MYKTRYEVSLAQAKYMLAAKEVTFLNLEEDDNKIYVYYFSPQWEGETDQPLTEERYNQQ